MAQAVCERESFCYLSACLFGTLIGVVRESSSERRQTPQGRAHQAEGAARVPALRVESVRWSHWSISKETAPLDRSEDVGEVSELWMLWDPVGLAEQHKTLAPPPPPRDRMSENGGP